MYLVKTKGIPFTALLKVNDDSVIADDYSVSIVDKKTNIAISDAASISVLNGTVRVSITIESNGIYEVAITSSDIHSVEVVYGIVIIDNTLSNVHRFVADTNVKVNGLANVMIEFINEKVGEINLVVGSISEEVNGLRESVDADVGIRLNSFKIALEGMLTDDTGKILRASGDIEKHLRGDAYTDENGEWVTSDNSIGFAQILSGISNMDRLEEIVSSILSAQELSFSELKETIGEIEIASSSVGGDNDILGALDDLMIAVDVRSVDMISAAEYTRETLGSIERTIATRFDSLDERVDNLSGKISGLSGSITSMDDKMERYKPVIYEMI